MTATAIRPADSPSDGALSHRQILTILSGLVLGMFLAALDQTIVSTAIKTIGNDLHDLQAQAWVTTAFLITSTIAAPLFGKLSDIYGRKRLFMIAIVIFVVGSALCGLAHLDVRAGRASAPSRASAPAASCRWRWPSSATSSRPASAPATRAT